MTDKELLELAAKAAEAEFESSDEDGIYLHQPIGGHSGFWNPLTDDGDALRLAVKLKFVSGMDLILGQYAMHEEWDLDPYAATRRAVVRAAAEIGKEKQ